MCGDTIFAPFFASQTVDMEKVMRQLMTLSVLVLVIASCGHGHRADNLSGKSVADSMAVADSGLWRIAVTPTLDCLPLMVAAERGFFVSSGVRVALCMYDSQMDIDTALQRRRVDGGMTDLVRASRLERDGLVLRRFSATDAMWQLLSKRTARIRQLKQLDDKMVAMTRYSATDMLSDMAVDSAGLKTERVFRIQVNDVSVRLGMLQNDIMDAMFLPEPQATAARNLKAHVLMDSRTMGLRLGVLVFLEERLQGRDSQLQMLRRGYDIAVDSLNAYGCRHYSEIMQRYMGVTPAIVDSLEGVSPRFIHVAPPRKEDVSRVEDWWQKRIESMRYVEKRYIQ